ncbi:putative reverse transcriptase domain-containing protein [Tanacetum coccineum]
MTESTAETESIAENESTAETESTAEAVQPKDVIESCMSILSLRPCMRDEMEMEEMEIKERMGMVMGTEEEMVITPENVARAYTSGNNEKNGYVGSLPYCNKCKLHHAGPCTVRCGNCKRVGHMTRDCKVAVTSNAQRALVGNQPGIICYECGRPGHFRKDCPKLRNQNRENQTGNKNGNKTGRQT